MAQAAFTAENAIEHRILAARRGDLSTDALMHEIADADLYAPSTTAPAPDGSGFRPVLLSQDGMDFVAVFTALSRQPRDWAGHTLRLTGRQLFLRMPTGFGVTINPETDGQILLPPDGMAALKADLRL